MASSERQVVEYQDKGQIKTCTVVNSVESATSAYVIGLLCADGGYGLMKKQYDRMTFYSSKEWAVKAMQRFFVGGQYRTRVRNLEVTNDIGVTYQYDDNVSYEYSIPSKSTASLKKFGIVCLKPSRVLAGIKDVHFKSAVLGFFDGDGSVVVRHRKDCRTPRLNIHIVTGAQKVAQHVQRRLEEDLGISSSIYVRSERCVELRINNTTSAIKFCQWIYSDLPEFYDKKKKGVFDRYMGVVPESCVHSDELLETLN